MPNDVHDDHLVRATRLQELLDPEAQLDCRQVDQSRRRRVSEVREPLGQLRRQRTSERQRRVRNIVTLG